MLETHTDGNTPARPRNRGRALATLFVLIVAVVAAAGTARAQGTSFMYQGRLTDAGANANGLYDLEFKLYDAAGGQVGAALTREDVQVTDGVFTVPLDFGLPPFATGTAFTLEIGVRPGSSNGAFAALAPRQPITSSPYAIQTINAAQLGGVPADQYVKTDDPRLTSGLPPAPGSNNYVQNSTAQQAGANFNIGGNGLIGGDLGIGTATPQSKLTVNTNGYGLTHTNGSVTVGSFLTTGSGWLGTRSNHPLNFFTNNGGAQMQLAPTGEVGIGVTPQAGLKLDVGGSGRFQTRNGNINLGTPNGETGVTFTGTNRADLRFDGATLKLLAGKGTGIPANTNGLAITTGGQVTIGTNTPAARVTIVNGAGPLLGGTALSVTQNSALGQGSAIVATGNVRQNLGGNGLVKAMALISYNGGKTPTIARCYNGITNSSNGTCGFPNVSSYSVGGNLGGVGVTRIDFGFQVKARFISTTPFGNSAPIVQFPDANTVDIVNNYADFFIFVF